MRLTLARSLLNKPRLWFLEEPTTGQDPQHAVSIRKLIRERADAGTSVFLTTHDMTVATSFAIASRFSWTGPSCSSTRRAS